MWVEQVFRPAAERFPTMAVVLVTTWVTIECRGEGVVGWGWPQLTLKPIWVVS